LYHGENQRLSFSQPYVSEEKDHSISGFLTRKGYVLNAFSASSVTWQIKGDVDEITQDGTSFYCPSGMNGTHTSSFSARLCFSLLSTALIATGIYLGRSILTPLFFSIILALILSPVTNFLMRRDMHRFLAILVPVVLGLLIIAMLVYFLSYQISLFFNDMPALVQRFNELMILTQKWVNQTFNIAFWQQDKYLDETSEKMKEEGPQFLQRTFITVTEIVSYFLLFPFYTFLILYHKNTIKKFLVEAFTRREEDRVVDVLHESQSIILQYVTGLLIELTIVFSLNATGFFIFEIKYPAFLALVAALLNIIPFIGMLVAHIFCILVTLISSENIHDIFIVAGVLAGVQVIDNNMLMPLVVGNKIRINALAIITGVMVGGALAGVPGMFLAIPGIALMKVIFERVKHLKPWATLLGDETVMDKEQRNPFKGLLNYLKKKRH
jgi:predicted PurR-regulated permease PerM